MLNKNISEKVIGRLSLYGRLLDAQIADNVSYIYSHQLAQKAGFSAAQVRRDLMAVGYTGSPGKGYATRQLLESIRAFIDAPTGQGVALVGIGNLGRAIMAYFAGRQLNLTIKVAFDTDPEKVGRVIHGHRCYALDEMPEVVRQENVIVGIIAVPVAAAQGVADRLVRAGVKGILNFAPVPLHVPLDVYVERIDMTMALEKVAYFARRKLNLRNE